MTNYYVELGLDRSASIETLEQELKALKKKWTSRASSAPNTEKRQQAERMVDLIREASETLLIKDNKAKYDKQLDKDPTAANAQQSYQQQAAPVPVNDNMAGAALVDLVEQFYDSSNYNQAIAAAKKAIATGNGSVELYRIMALCYAERGDNSGAFGALREMISAYPEDANAHFVYARLCLRVLENHESDAKPSIDWLINAGYGEEGPVVALDVEYSIDNNEMSLAESKINQYLEHNKNDKDFRQAVCRAYAQYADRYLTEYGGDVYFDNELNFNNWLATTEKALAIYPDSSIKKNYDQNVSFKKKTFIKDNWMGILCGFLYMYGAFGSGNAFLGIVSLLFTIAMIYFSFVPNWQLLRFNYTKHLSGPYEVFRYINIAFSFILRIGWAIVKFILNLAFGLSLGGW